MIEVTILVPKHDNSGVEFTDEQIHAFERMLCSTFGGATVVSDGTRGIWLADDGERVDCDRHRRYIVAIPGMEGFVKVMDTCDDICRRFKQDCVYVSYLGYSEIL